MQGVIMDVVKKRVMIEDYKVQAIRKRQIFLNRTLEKKNVSKNKINLYAIECV